jgi:glycosyltransferase involved in cell wall biosynthesis
MRVLNIVDSLRPGGVRERTSQLSRALLGAGHDPVILSPAQPPDAGGIPGDLERSVVIASSIGARFPLPYALRTIWREIKRADVIQFMSHWSLLHVIAHLAARIARKPYVMCPAGALRIYGRSQAMKRFYNFVAGKRIVRGAARLIAITPDEYRTFEPYRVEPDQMVVLPNAVNVAQFVRPKESLFRQVSGAGAAPYVLFLGRLNPIKGPDLLLRAFLSVREELGNLHLVFAGPDEGMGDSLRAIAGSDDRVHFAGSLSGAMKVDALSNAEFVAIPSRHEAMSIVVLEAGACGAAVLATDTCGFPEVEAAGGGCVVAPSVEALAQGLLKMRDCAASGAGEKLRALVEREYSWDSSVQSHLALFQQVIDESSEVR